MTQSVVETNARMEILNEQNTRISQENDSLNLRLNETKNRLAFEDGSLND